MSRVEWDRSVAYDYRPAPMAVWGIPLIAQTVFLPIISRVPSTPDSRWICLPAIQWLVSAPPLYFPIPPPKDLRHLSIPSNGQYFPPD